MKGWRTLAFNFAWLLLTVVVADTSWVDRVPPKYTVLAMLFVNFANIGLRFITNTPVGRGHDSDSR